VRRLLVVLAVASIVTSGLFLYIGERATADLSKTWTSDTDFAGGTFTSTEVVGTGTAASIRLQVRLMYDWVLLYPGVSPSPRRGPAMTYDERDGVLLAFGGLLQGGSYSDELWTYDVATDTWTDITPASSPPARWKAGFSYDPDGQVAILYGGLDDSGWRSDLWGYYVSNNTWRELFPPPVTPRGIQGTPLVYDVEAKMHIMAGTNSITSAFETWAYDAVANRWSNRNPTGDIPPATQGHTLTYDRNAHVVILFGGAEGLTVYGDLYEYTYTTNRWVLAVPWRMNETPNPRTDHAMVFGPNNLVSVLFGGTGDDGSYQPGTWHFDPTREWTQPLVTVYPASRRDHAMAWDSTLDRLVMFGGMLFDGTITNETWMWGPGYSAGGTYESPVFDAGCESPLWHTLWWNASVPPRTSARFRLATSNSPTGTFTYRGWDGLPGTSYNGTPGQTIWAGHSQPPDQRYFRWRLSLTSGTGSTTPDLLDFGVNYECFAQLPYVESTYPRNLQINVPRAADIIVTFNVAMDESTVSWTFSDPGITFTPSWDPTHTVLTLSHVTSFVKCTQHTMQIFGKDLAHGYDLVVGPVPNPWKFSTDCSAPKILETTPRDGAFSVPLDANLLVRFSDSMDTATVRWTIDGGITLTGSWNPAESELNLSHTTPFATCTVYTANITAAKDKLGIGIVPGPVPNPWSFTTVCPNPYIAATDPEDGATGVIPSARIIVTFRKPMDTASVAWTIIPILPLTADWNSPTDTVLTLNHATTFTEIATYTVNITGGREKGGLPLIPGPVPNPWSFRVAGVRPEITRTVPADGDTDVALDAGIVVTFSEAMLTSSVTVTISPNLALTKSWNAPTNTVLTLTHTAAFAVCTVYTVNVSGTDLQSFRLAPGPVPNPWSFTTYCPLLGPGHLRVLMAGPDVGLTWDPVTGATSYRVFSAQNRFAAWSTWTLLGSTAAPPFLATGHGADGLTHYYVVRAVDVKGEGPNSSMGVKTTLSFTLAPVNTNVAWFSLPFSSTYTRASSIASALGSANIDVVGKWVLSKQSSVVYYYSRGAWRGTDFTISPGDGLYLGVRRTFSWNVTGTDLNVSLSFTLNPPGKANVNWVGIPYTGVYSKASDISSALGSSKITEVGLWNAATQSVTRWYWSGTAWTGTDFTFAPGAGVYIIVASDFTWRPTLITPAVP